ncbi:MAG: copper-translocating P-type ATPase [Firmicutes bacterium]|nr:copper-translocating P-type ATPase [Bacillota bacterium]
MRDETYKITGMHCAACSASVERVTRKLPGVEQSEVNLMAETMHIVYDEALVTPEQIGAKIEKAGFGMEELPPVSARWERLEVEGEGAAEKAGLISACVLSAVLMYASMGQMLTDALWVPDFLDMMSHPLNLAIFEMLLSLAVLCIGRRYIIGGYKALFHLAPNMDSLVAIGCSCSFLYSLVMALMIPSDKSYVHQLYFESAAVVLTLIMVGKYMESGSKDKTKDAIKSLLQLVPDTAIRVDAGALGAAASEAELTAAVTAEVPTDSLQRDDIILIKSGARIPTDAVIISGEGSVDESMLTGESLPVPKGAGDMLIGGSVTYNGTFYAKVAHTGGDTTISAIVRFIEQAQAHKAPISRLADKVAGVFVPAVMAIALVAAIIWLIAGKDLAFALKIFTAVLVVACPCSLGLATPTAVMVGTGVGARNGILLRSGEALEIAGKIDTVVLDKTGTVTSGKMRLRKVIAQNKSAAELLACAAAVEKLSAHPLAKAIVAGAEEKGATKDFEISDFLDIPGKGARANVNGREYIFGSARLMEENNIDVSALSDHAQELAELGCALVYAAESGICFGLLGVSDTVREESKAAVAALKNMGIEVIMMTGDSRAAGESTAAEVGIGHVLAEVLPEGKAGHIEKLQSAGHRVMMVGDGINDAPALTMANIGVAIGSGSDIALESGDIVLMKSDILDIPRAVKLSRATMRNIKQNLFWAFFYNCIGIPIAAGVLYPAFGFLLSPMIAGLAMSLSSICVVSNALRLRRVKLENI